MHTSLSDLALLVDGQLHGSGEIVITDAATLREAGAGHITFLSDSKYGCDLSTCSASAVLAPPDFVPEGIAYITVQNVPASFARIVAHFRPPRVARSEGISAAAHVAHSAKIGVGVSVFPGAYIGEDVEIGDGCVIHSGARILDGCRIAENVTIFPNAVLYENTRVGARVIIHAGAVLGAYGFGYATTADGRHRLSEQLGYVVVEQDVEIGAASTIDRGTYGATTIGEGTKIDNQVMIAHNCSIGRHNILCSQVGIAGSTRTGDYVVMAGQVGVRDHVNIGERAVLGAKTGIKNDVPAGSRYFGIPGTPEREQMIQQAAFRRLPEMRKLLKALKKQVDRLETRVAGGETLAESPAGESRTG